MVKAKQKTIWVCTECGNKQLKWAGSCSVCQKWNTLFEEEEIIENERHFGAGLPSSSKPTLIQEVELNHFCRVQTGFSEFDRLIGGGIVTGSLILLGGEPGIGKSTLLLQLAEKLANQGLIVLYVCGEESLEQTSLRAKRLRIVSKSLYLLNEILFSHIQREVEKLKPDILIIDSVQIVYKSEIPSAPGSVTQVREVAMECLLLSKSFKITTFLVGHVTKSGDLAGPRVLEHMVDVVFEFEGDRQQGYRLIRSLKNRFGPTDDIVLFQMDEQGLKEITNPSLTFLEERMIGSSGSVMVPTLEGSRAILVEIQALVAPASFATSTRRCTGLDSKRLTLLLAVLEKKMAYQLHSLDVFVSIAGGLRITEPAADLAAILSIASSYCNRPLPSDTVVVGEVGLSGEVRSVPRVESRLKEAINMGFKKCLLSKKNCLGCPSSLVKKIELIGVERVEEAIQELLG